jgi:transposase
MTPPPDLADKDALIATLLARIEALMAANARLTVRVAELEAKLGAPPKTPDNSSVPPSKGRSRRNHRRPRTRPSRMPGRIVRFIPTRPPNAMSLLAAAKAAAPTCPASRKTHVRPTIASKFHRSSPT